ncbi:MAG TPA: ribonuclease HII [Terriglobia bacterium]|nr:ribonuclease HII [Terriglobia bacterium]
MPRIRDEKQLECTWRLERHAYSRGITLVAGCDEAGRGAMIGPLTAAAVMLDPAKPIPGLNDSKKLTPSIREELAGRIRKEAITYKVIFISAGEVDRLNVYQASRIAMIRALGALAPAPQYILTDAMRLWSDLSSSEVIAPFRCLIHGDARSVSIAAASILAKVERDAHMRELDRQYPQYGLAQNKGYCTAYHLQTLKQHGPCPEHRKTFQPVNELQLRLSDL